MNKIIRVIFEAGSAYACYFNKASFSQQSTVFCFLFLNPSCPIVSKCLNRSGLVFTNYAVVYPPVIALLLTVNCISCRHSI